MQNSEAGRLVGFFSPRSDYLVSYYDQSLRTSPFVDGSDQHCLVGDGQDERDRVGGDGDVCTPRE
jgi:hypothetical protein